MKVGTLFLFADPVAGERGAVSGEEGAERREQRGG